MSRVSPTGSGDLGGVARGEACEVPSRGGVGACHIGIGPCCIRPHLVEGRAGNSGRGNPRLPHAPSHPELRAKRQRATCCADPGRLRSGELGLSHLPDVGGPWIPRRSPLGGACVLGLCVHRVSFRLLGSRRDLPGRSCPVAQTETSVLTYSPYMQGARSGSRRCSRPRRSSASTKRA